MAVWDRAQQRMIVSVASRLRLAGVLAVRTGLGGRSQIGTQAETNPLLIAATFFVL